MSEQTLHYGCKFLLKLIAYLENTGELPAECLACSRLERGDNFKCTHPDDAQVFSKQEDMQVSGIVETQFYLKCKLCGTMLEKIDEETYNNLKRSIDGHDNDAK